MLVRLRRHHLGTGLAILSGPIAAIALLLAYLCVSDRTVLGEAITIWPPIGWGFLLLVRAAVLRFQGRNRIAVATLVATIGFLGATVEWRSLARRTALRDPSRVVESSNAGAVPLRVVTWNVAGAAPLDELADLSPDLCLLQEIGSLAAAARRSPQWRDNGVIEGFDPGIVSRFPMRRLPSQRVGPWIEPLVACVDLPAGRRIVVVNVRLVLPAFVTSFESPLEWGRLAAGHSDRLAQFPRLVALVERARREQDASGAILAGDFNTPAGMASEAPLRSALRDVWPLVGAGWGATMTAELPLARIDQVWVSGSIAPLTARVERRGTSDHRLVVVDLLVR